MPELFCKFLSIDVSNRRSNQYFISKRGELQSSPKVDWCTSYNTWFSIKCVSVIHFGDSLSVPCTDWPPARYPDPPWCSSWGKGVVRGDPWWGWGLSTGYHNLSHSSQQTTARFPFFRNVSAVAENIPVKKLFRDALLRQCSITKVTRFEVKHLLFLIPLWGYCMIYLCRPVSTKHTFLNHK